MKLSIFTVSTPGLQPEELARLAKETGVEGIEWRYKNVPEDAVQEEPSFWRNNLCSIPEQGGEDGWRRFKDAADGQGLATLSVTPYLTAGDLESTEQVLEAARYLQAKFIRLGVHWYDGSRSFRDLFEQQVKYLEEAQRLCKAYGVKGLVETHHRTIASSASGTYRLVERLDPDWIGVLYDPGNMVHEGFEPYRMGLEMLGPYLAHVHVKNAIWKSPEQSGDGSGLWEAEWGPLAGGVVPWERVIADLNAVGYDGYLGLEDFYTSRTQGPREMLQAFVAYMGSMV